jgi:DNA-binding CsgD family transcriptional regulator
VTHHERQHVVAGLAALCDPAAAPSTRAAAALRGLAGVVPHEAAAVTCVDRATGRHALVASRGYAPQVVAYLLGEFVARDAGWRRACAHPGEVLSWRDVPHYRQHDSARRWFVPAGYAEGSSICLLDEAGALVGAVHLSVRGREFPDEARAALGLLRTPFAALAADHAMRVGAGLSDREVEILRLVAAGLSNAEIADVLVVARRTVATHVEHVLTKLDARNRAHAAVLAARRGLV